MVDVADHGNASDFIGHEHRLEPFSSNRRPVSIMLKIAKSSGPELSRFRSKTRLSPNSCIKPLWLASGSRAKPLDPACRQEFPSPTLGVHALLSLGLDGRLGDFASSQDSGPIQYRI